MPRKLPLHVYSERTRHGRVVFYFRQGHGPRIRLPDDPRDPAFAEAVRAAHSGGTVPSRPDIPAQDKNSLAALLSGYMAGSHFQGLSRRTRENRKRIFNKLIAESGHHDARAIKRTDIVRARERRTPNAANDFLKAIRPAFAWAHDIGLIEHNPAADVSMVTVRSEGYHTWTLAEVDRFEARHGPGTPERRALRLLLFTGLRRGDVVQLDYEHRTVQTVAVDGEPQPVDVIEWQPGKGDSPPVTIPVLEPLADVLDPDGAGPILHRPAGERWTDDAFGRWFAAACRAAGVPGRAHGLRKAGATIAAEGGASPWLLMAIWGWKTLRMAEHYTRAADRRRMGLTAGKFLALR